METTAQPPSIHHRRRWFYVLWVALLAAAAGGALWWETPAREGIAHLHLSVRGKDLPAGTRGILWVGPTDSWKGVWSPAESQVLTATRGLGFGPRPVRIAHRRLRQGLLMRRTDDLVIVVLEAPSGDRRFLVYDLRDEMGTTLGIGRSLTLNIACTWEDLRRTPDLPPGWQRRVVGH